MRLKKKNGRAKYNEKLINIITKFIIVLIVISIVLLPNNSFAESDKRDVESEFLSSIDMVIDILENDKDISDYANTYKYIYHKYTGAESYKTELDFSTYNMSDSSYNSVSSESGFDLFLKWLHTYEGGKKTEDGKFYIVESDGSATGLAVGHGVDINTHKAELQAAGYSISIGSQIPVDIVDAIEEKEVNEKIKAVRAKTNGLNLKEYQIYALVSRAYNCGIGGAFSSRNGLTFNQAYNKYWNQDRDDKYNQKDQVKYNHNLYDQYMSKPNTSQGQVLRGLIERRKSEWLLFQTGYFDRGVEAYWKEDENIAQDINTPLTGDKKEKMEKLIAEATKIANDVNYKYYTYSQANRMGKYSYDCSSFCARLYKEFFDINIPSTTSVYGSKGYKGLVGSVELQPGDILWRSGHVELYIGNNKRAGAHMHYASHPKDDISIKSGTEGFTKVYRFVE